MRNKAWVVENQCCDGETSRKDIFSMFMAV